MLLSTKQQEIKRYIGVFPNIFHCTVKNTETEELHKFEISCRKNQLEELVKFVLDNTKLFCGYNNIHYDNPIINYMIDYYEVMKYKGYRDICKSIFNLSKVITTD